MNIHEFVNRLDSLGFQPKQSGKGYLCKCPAHEDNSPSLSVNEGNEGKILINCFAGCSTQDICSAVGIELKDLMPERNDILPYRHSRKPSSKPSAKPSINTKPKQSPAASTSDDPRTIKQVAGMFSKLGKPTNYYPYRDHQGRLVGIVFRWDRQAGKEIRQAALVNGQWQTKAMPQPRPLYNLTALTDAETVYVCEGEKCVEALTSLGLAAATSAGGSQAANKADWSPLAGKRVVVLPDADEPGRKYANDVCGLLDGVAQSIRVVELKSLEGETPKGFDIFDWIQDQRQLTPDSSDPELVDKLQSLCGETESLDDEPQEANVWKPFPVEALPPAMRTLVAEGAEAIGCDPCMIALPALCVAGAAIGNAASLRVKQGWFAPPLLWGVVVCESGSAKTPAFHLAKEFTERMNSQAIRENAKNEAECTDVPPKRFLVNDATFEAMAPILNDNPKGVLLVRDELAGFIGAFDRYSSKAGADRANWLSIYSTQGITIDRKSGFPRTIHVRHPFVSVTGTIQLGVLARMFSADDRESGLLARFLVANPPQQPRYWTEAVVQDGTVSHWEETLSRLFALALREDDSGRLLPIVFKMSSEAKALWIEFYDRNADEKFEASGDLAAALSKLEEAAARIALVLHLVDVAGLEYWREHDWQEMVIALQDGIAPDWVCEIDARNMAKAIEITEFFKHEARRLYGTISPTPQCDDPKEQLGNKLLSFVRGKEGTPLRDIQRRFKLSAVEADEVLKPLISKGLVAWRERKSAKGPTSRFLVAIPA